MNEIAINVRGSHTTTVPPERGIVHVALSLEGPQPKPVFDATALLVDIVRSDIQHLHDEGGGPITWFSIDRLTTSARRPWHKDGKQLPLIHSASVAIKAKFVDFDALAKWIGWGAGIEGFSIEYVEWALTESRRREVERDARTQAILAAQQRAQDYSDALRLGPVQVSSIDDTGVRVTPHQQRMTLNDLVADAEASSPAVYLSPENVEIDATVEASFLVRVES